MTYPELPKPDLVEEKDLAYQLGAGGYSVAALLAYGKAVQEWAAKVCEEIAAEEEEASPHKNYDLIAFNCAQAIREGKS